MLFQESFSILNNSFSVPEYFLVVLGYYDVFI